MRFNTIGKLLFPELHINYQNSRINIPALDGVRGIAISLVLLFHCFRFSYGWSGVDLFFVLSGFLITGILLDSKNKERYFRNFWLRRVLRIFPLYYLILILIWIPKLFFNLDTIGEPSITYWLYIDNWKFTIDGEFPTGKGTLNHFWSLAIEEQFYLFFPVIIRYTKPKMLLIIIFGLIVTSIFCRWYFWSIGNNTGYYVFTFSRMDALSIGALLAYLIRYKRNVISKWVHPIFYGSILLFLISQILGNSFPNKYFVIIGYTLTALFYSTILVYSISSFRYNYFTILFNNRILRFIGKLAYGIYVYHYIFYVLVKPTMESMIFNVTKNSFLSKTIVSILIVFISIFVSYVSYHFMEKKFLGLKDKLTDVQSISS